MSVLIRGGRLLLAWMILVPGTSLAEATQVDVLASVKQLEDEVELVRAYMGRQRSELRDFMVDSATNRHSFFLAQTIVRKLNTLLEENAGAARQSAPAAPSREILPDDVLGVLGQAHDQMRFLKQDFGIADSPRPRGMPGKADETDVVEAMVRVLRQVNLMLLRRYLPQDVYERLDLATVYVAGVLKNQNQALFPAIEFEPYKQPIDVFRKLLDCAALSAAIADRAGVDALQLDVRRMRASETRLSNNYDLATILLSDIAEWTAALQGADDVFPETDLRRHTVPSHVYQKARQLEAQLQSVLDFLSD